MVLAVALQSATLGYYGNWATSTETWAVNVGHTTRTVGDSVRARTTFSWLTSRIADLNHSALAHGAHFTMQADDNNANLNAVSGSTTMPAPYCDRDDDNQDGRHEEAEITTESVPQANMTYSINLYFMHWIQAC